MIMPDINVWIGLTFDSHTSHISAKAWWDNLPATPLVFSRMTQQGFIRISTDARLIGAAAYTLDDAWTQYDAYLAYPQINFIAELPGVETLWRSFSSRNTRSPKLVNDAYLAAFAICANLELVTFDQGFTQFVGLNCTILK
jgi:toxin-antitoxin system PIN domain toxin